MNPVGSPPKKARRRWRNAASTSPITNGVLIVEALRRHAGAAVRARVNAAGKARSVRRRFGPAIPRAYRNEPTRSLSHRRPEVESARADRQKTKCYAGPGRLDRSCPQFQLGGRRSVIGGFARQWRTAVILRTDASHGGGRHMHPVQHTPRALPITCIRPQACLASALDRQASRQPNPRSNACCQIYPGHLGTKGSLIASIYALRGTSSRCTFVRVGTATNNAERACGWKRSRSRTSGSDFVRSFTVLCAKFSWARGAD
jgi:hypothetical protein